MIQFSPGILQGCFELLEITSRNALSFSQILSSFPRLGCIPGTNALETAQYMKWLRTNSDGLMTLTPTGVHLLSQSNYKMRLKQALLDFIDVAKPSWVQNATFGRKKVISFVGNYIEQTLIEAGLANGSDDEVVLFWDTLAAMARGQKTDRLMEIGRIGERLTINHEEMRTGLKPKWVSIDNNSDGYDVLSVVDNQNKSFLSIEVKTSTIGLSGAFHLTSNEWSRSKVVDNHLFHLWDISNKNQSLAKITCEQMERHIPMDQGSGNWESVEIPFAVFKEHFENIINPRTHNHT
ncbi:MAG: hypothetical protein A3E85_04655 [Gammaproteobacteria bacterium RIFCSPHIGHO2_12_FULL_45_12]|nr:MAG: hypothetical protein A3E85_04655 [Gammaproteobacteria bacterium RIFCSPHIGHO2_12_FULL_45_12]